MPPTGIQTVVIDCDAPCTMNFIFIFLIKLLFIWRSVGKILRGWGGGKDSDWEGPVAL